ncbi:gephyrin-like molybdotransferase Glp [Paenibacillus solisilvae]|uniref:Molybdopterin molybdenumtransferase n=1 Tax=Paenibacillus solisilvae TaxID=2486751 RepID=A0ABW0VVY4_9BACL
MEAQARKGVAVEDGLELLFAHTGKRTIKRVPLMESLGRVLAGDCYSPFPIPSFRKAAMDGYAVKYSEIKHAAPENPVVLRVTDEIKPGSVEFPAGHHFAVRIFTGAPVPEPYDTVIMQEAVIAQEDESSLCRFLFPSERGKHVAEIGEDIPANACIITEGTVISAKEIAILAAFGTQDIEVYRKPIVAVIPVGDELQLPGEALSPYHLYESNGFMLEAKLRELGADCIRYAPVPDNKSSISQAIQAALRDADFIITTGGISVGKYDYLLDVMNELSAEALFTKVLMRPGAPTSVYKIKETLSFHLSGNPSACFVGYELFVKPKLLFELGCSKYRNEMMEAVLEGDVSKPCPYPRYVRSFAEIRKGKLYVAPLTKDQSGNLAAFAKSNALSLILAGGKGAAKGQVVQMFWI